MIIIFGSIMALALSLVHFIIYKLIVTIFSLSVVWRIFTGVILAILGISFVIASILTFYFNNSFTSFLYTTSASWLGFAVYLFIFSCLFFIVLWILHVFNLNVSLQYFGILCFSLAIIFGIYGIIHARQIIVKDINVSISNLPASWQGKKAVWISDLHLGAVYGRDFTRSIVVKINEINPDIVFIGGDIYDGVKINESEVIEPLIDLHPKLGTYFITGNHEEFRDDKHYLNAIRGAGIKVLNNEMVMIDGMQLIGVDDRDSTNVVKLKAILSGLNIDKSTPSILLKHQPSQLAEAAKAGITFQISGHTHRAQMFPLNLFTSLIYKGYDYGFHKIDKMNVFTSSGTGTWGPPMRVGSDAEIVVLTFLK
ncbi:MAG: metallophosphoesterase [Candidatus Taylorbacteria bacterium]|nr:metallophosphoesterase [Candidatus Taylorbacteria bacterium]